jgi:hypothetical protein
VLLEDLSHGIVVQFLAGFGRRTKRLRVILVSVVATRTRALSALGSSFGLRPLPGLLSKVDAPDLACRMRKEETIERGILVLWNISVGV